MANPKALLIVADQNILLPGEVAVQERLNSLDYDVITGDNNTQLDVRDITLMVVSSSVVDQAFGERLRDLVVPIIVSTKELYIELGMCRTRRG